jgi:AraC family transcriptional regulator
MGDRQAYVARINRVIDHIDGHLGEALDLGRLAAVACLSPWHFHRIFQALTGETLAERVRRRRLEVAAARLLASPPRSALQVALEVGFGSAEVFTRAFKAHFSVTPTGWRRGGFRAWAAGQRGAMRKIHQADRKANQDVAAAFGQDRDLWPPGDPAGRREGGHMDIEMRTLPETRVAYMRHVGPYGTSGIPRLWQRFAAWCAAEGLMQPRPLMFGIAQDSPDLTAPDKCRYDACVEIDAAFQPTDEVGVQVIPGGRCACARFVGTSSEIHDAWMRFLSGWLPDSGYQGDDRPAVELYERDFTMNPETGAFPCLLCLPVRPL